MAGAVSNNNFFVECGTCGKGFESDAKCDSHLTKVCDLGNCNHKEFNSPAELKRHQSIHGVPTKTYVCGINGCEYSNVQSGNFNRHQRSVHGMR